MNLDLPLPEGRRSALARDLARSGSKPVNAVCQREQRAALGAKFALAADANP